MLAFILLAMWVLIFAPLVIVPLLPRVDGPQVMRAPRAVAEKKVVMLATSRTEHAA
jgi:hypothetical protein